MSVVMAGGTGQLEYNTDSTDNVRLTGDGFLEIVAQREEYEGNEYTSGRILTEGLWTGGYGKYEARIKLPEGQGFTRILVTGCRF